MKTCVFAGTFDPITKGHEAIINTCLSIFDEVVIAVGVNAEKRPLFTENERIALIESAFDGNPRIKVQTFHGLLVEFMRENGYEISVRGIRNVDDYKYENEMFIYNTEMYPELKTLFIPSDKETAFISSTALRALYVAGGDIAVYLPYGAINVAKEMLKTK